MFGISLLHLNEESEIPLIPEIFRIVEFPGHYLNHAEKLQKLSQDFIFNDLFPIALTREIALQNQRIQDNFLCQCSSLMDCSARLESSGIIVDFEVESGFSDQNYHNATTALLKKLAADLLRTASTLLLPVRFPFKSEAEGSSEKYLTTLKNLLSPQFGFVVNVYPHELAGKELDIQKLLHWLRFDTKAIRFVYEPETGNRLVKRLLTPWVKMIHSFGMDIPLIAAPMIEHSETLEYELLLLRDLFIDLHNENEKELKNVETWRKC
ncbi:MAG: hypothetical protein PHI56_01745 [Victivallaceae bacterium]|nr:hypothetical protein [Victivallaceae bacterium]MDD3703213.1 hypothetical protein [Victivallaceae bacterium]